MHNTFNPMNLSVQSALQQTHLHSPTQPSIHSVTHVPNTHRQVAHSESSTRLGEALTNAAISKQEDQSLEKDPGVLLEIGGFLTLAWGPGGSHFWDSHQEEIHHILNFQEKGSK